MTPAIATLMKFYPPWLLAAAIAAEAPAEQTSLVLHFDGLDLPVLQLGLAVAGVLLARPLSPKRVPPLGWVKQALTTLIMLLIAAAWTIESRPGLLFGFVVSIGLGFSGFALIELAGREVRNFVKGIFTAAGGLIGKGTGKDQ